MKMMRFMSFRQILQKMPSFSSIDLSILLSNEAFYYFLQPLWLTRANTSTKMSWVVWFFMDVFEDYQYNWPIKLNFVQIIQAFINPHPTIKNKLFLSFACYYLLITLFPILKMKKALALQNSTASSEWINTLNVNELGISYDEILSERNLEGNDDEEGGEFGQIEYEDFQLLQGNQQDDIFVRILKNDNEDSLWNQTSQLHFQEEQYFQPNQHPDPTLQVCHREEPSLQDQSAGLRGDKVESVSCENNKNSKSLQSKEERRFKKNVNVPKAIGRYLMDYHELYEKTLFEHEQPYYQQLSRQLKDLKAWVRKSKKNSFKLAHLNHFFSNPSQTRSHSSLTRLMMRRILQKCLRSEIIPNNQVKDKLEYLVATKVFSLRCTNPKLSTRMQMH